MTKSELVVRWALGLLCLALEVVVVSIVIAAVSRSTDTDELFFWHPVLMTIGVILFLSHGVRAYTSYAGVSRGKLRVVHGLLSGLWVCLSMAGFGIIVQNKRNSDFEHFTTTHGRLGLGVLFFSLLQGVAGTLKLFVLFKNNKRFLRWHGRMGTLVFASAVTTFLTGVNFLLEGGPEQDTVITTYVLTFVLALITLFVDFFAKGFDLVPQDPEDEKAHHYVRLNDPTHMRLP